VSLPKIEKKFLTVRLLSEPTREVRYRPYTSGEEKAFLLAVETQDEEKMADALYDLLDCCVEGGGVRDLTPADVQMLFLRLRQASKGESYDFSWRCEAKVDGKECGQRNTASGTITDDVVLKPAGSGEVKVGRFIVRVRYPTAREIDALQGTDIEKTFRVLSNAVVAVVDGPRVYEGFTPEERDAWLDELPADDAHTLMKGFAEIVPSVTVKKSVKCVKCGQERLLEVADVTNFIE
jgi:hypothetical protein